ncbi:hypothetical protein EJD97_016062 [Solanum chilense]|uniref:Uncharacterized protein n=1 Tax=Solanum chilense TaxID=4083 RepID=A0A6N2C9P2_SOLCI|nr:hypothetical protein EJD97_016062 [Solanum chilense]
MELSRATTIKRDRVVNTIVVFDGVDCGCINVGVGADVSVSVGVGVDAGQDQGATSCRRCCGFLCEKCMK